jgi:hypothetical protein
MDQFDQCRGLHHGIKFFKDHHLKQCALMVKEAFSKIEPRLARVRLVTLWLGRRVVGERLRVPSQPQCLEALLRAQSQQFGMRGFGLSKRGEDSVQMGSQRLPQFWPQRSIALCAQAAQPQQLGADASDRTEPTAGRTAVEGVVEQMEPESKLIVARDGLLTRMMGVFIGVETLVEMGLAFGVVECVRRLVLLRQSRIGFTRQWAAPVKEVSTRMQPSTPPARVWARRMLARHEAASPSGGHADAVEVVLTEIVNMGLPGLG